MLDFMRKHASSIIIKVILGIVILAFVLYFGFTGRGSSAGEVVAKVDGLSIRGREFIRAYREMVERYRALFGNQVTEEMLEKLDIKRMVLDGLIERTLLLVEAKNLGLKVSNQELRDAIAEFPLFQENGQFNPGLYRGYLSRAGLTASEFEDALREQILIRKLTGILLSSIKISDAELDEYFRIKEERLIFDYLEINPEYIKINGDIREEDIRSFFEEHREDFRIPPSVKLRFITYRIGDVEKDINISNEEIEGFYRDNPHLFREARRIRLREIYFPLRSGDPESVEKAGKGAREAYEELSKGGDFTTVARKFSINQKGISSGQVLLFSESELDPNIANVAFSMREGEFSKPIITKNGIHIIKVEKIYEGKLKPLIQVKRQIMEILKKEKATGFLSEIAEKAVWDAAKAGGLNKYASSKGLRLFETGMINEMNRDSLPEGLIKKALISKEGEILKIVEKDRAIVAEVVRREDSRIPELSELKNRVKERLLREMAMKKARGIAEDILSQALKSGSFKEYPREGWIRSGKTKPMRRSELNMAPFMSGQWASEIASLGEKNPILSKVIEKDGKLYIVKLSKRISPDEGGMKRDQLIEELKKIKGEDFLKMYVRSLRDRYRVKIYMK